MYTNIFPIELEFEDFKIQRLPYSDEELKFLRKKYNSTHSFFRNGGHIYISNKSGEDLNMGLPYDFNINNEPDITLSIMRHIFFKTFLDRFKGRIPLAFHPFRILSSRESDDWVYNLLPDHLKGRLGYIKQIELQIQTINVNNINQFVLIANIERRWLFDINCQDLLDLGFDPTGYEVIHSEIISGLQNILAPNEEFIGRVLEVKDKIAVIDSADGKIEIDLKELFLRKTTHNIVSFISKICGDQTAEKILSNIKSNKKENLKHKNRWEEIKKIVDSFTYTIAKLADEKVLYQNKDGFAFTINASPLIFDNSFELKNPTFIYDKAGVKVNSNSADYGLSSYGPYDSNVFHAKSPRILSICHKTNRGRFTVFLQHLFDGISDSKYFTKGFKGKFELHSIQNQVFDIVSYTIEEYKQVLNDINSNKPDLVIVELDDNIKFNDPLLYFRIKAMMLTREIPMQVILKSKVDGYNEYILNSIALQLYAKLGGVPWVLKSSMSVDREIVIGIGHSIIRKGAYSGFQRDRVVGLTTFFSSDGQYLLSNKAKDVPYEKYFDELLKNLKESFEQLQTANNWKSGDTIRLIFHIFKPIKNVEFDVVADLIKSYPNFKIQFAFVTVGKNHPYLLFDHLGGKASYKNGREYKTGEFIPNRGTNLKLDKHACLIQMLGGKDIKSDSHGASNPLLVKIRIPTGDKLYQDIEPLLFVDLQYIVQQLFSFTNLSWRNYLPSEHPATMLYSELIAKQLGRLRKIEGWSPDILNYALKTKKWFL